MKITLLINATIDPSIEVLTRSGTSIIFKSPHDADSIFPAVALDEVLMHMGIQYIRNARIRVVPINNLAVNAHMVSALANISNDVMYSDYRSIGLASENLSSTRFYFYHNRPAQCENNQLPLPFPEDATQAKHQ